MSIATLEINRRHDGLFTGIIRSQGPTLGLRSDILTHRLHGLELRTINERFKGVEFKGGDISAYFDSEDGLKSVARKWARDGGYDSLLLIEYTEII